MPESIRELGIVCPTPTEFLRACEAHGASFRVRAPGFEVGTPAAAAGRIATCLQAVGPARRGEAPTPLAATEIERIHATPRETAAYYRGAYADVLADSVRLWEALADLPAPTS